MCIVFTLIMNVALNIQGVQCFYPYLIFLMFVPFYCPRFHHVIPYSTQELINCKIALQKKNIFNET